MNALAALVALSVLAPVASPAQTRTSPARPMTPLPPTAPVAPVRPVPPVSAAPMAWPDLSEFELPDVEAIREQALEAIQSARADMILQGLDVKLQGLDTRQIAEQARQAAELEMANVDVKQMTEQARRAVEKAREIQETHAFAFNQGAGLGMGQGSSSGRSDAERSAYDRGQSALSERQYEQAITRFDQAIAARGTRTDAALYWKAFAQFKLGRSADATATLAELQKMKDSKYLADAKALDAEIKRMAGQPARPENEDNEDLKLLALQGLINSDPERAIPLVQNVLSSASSLKLKDRALYVLALSNSAQAHQSLVTLAKSGTPDLQLKAIRYLGLKRGRDGTRMSSAELAEIFTASQNDDVKRAIVRAYGTSGDRAALMVVLNGSTSQELRREVVIQLGVAQAWPELATTYQKEANRDVRLQILNTLGAMGGADRLVEIARSEKDADLRNRAIRSLGNAPREKTGAALADIYGVMADVDAKKATIQALGNQGNAEALIVIARKEQSFELKRTVVERLTNMPKNKAAQDYLMEIIK